MIITVFKMMLTLFILCAAGFFARRHGIINDDFSRRLSRLVIEIAQPFLIVYSVISAEYSKAKLFSGLAVVGIGLLCHTIMAFAAHLYSRFIHEFNEAKIVSFAIIFTNCGFLGLPVIGETLGADGQFYGAFYLISFNLFLWSWGMILLGKGRTDIKLNPKKLVLNYGTTPCLVGIALYMLKPFFELPDFMLNAFNFLGSLCTPLSQLIIGGLIATRSAKSFLLTPKIYLFSLYKLIAVPLAFALVCRLVGAGEFMTYFITVMTALPSASNAAMFGEIYDIKPGYAAELVGMTTVLSVATIPLVLHLAGLILSL